MDSRKKLRVSVIAMLLVTVLAVTSIIAVFASNRHSFISNISVKYKASQIEGKVLANYYVGEEDTEGTPMTTTGQPEGAKELIFNASDESMSADALNPQGDIVLSLADNELGTKDKRWVGV